MRIHSIRAHPLSVPLAEPLWTAHERLATSSLVLVEVRTVEGATGIGQIHGAPLGEISGWVERFGELLRGMNALEHVAIREKLFALTHPRPGGVAGRDGSPPPLARAARPQIMAAIGGIDIALWDLKGKAAGMPVFRLLGGANRPVFTYATGGYYREDGDDDAGVREMAAFAAKGFRGVKLKCCGGPMDAEVDRVRRARAAIGPDVLLMLDMNAAYTVDDCIRFARGVEPFGIHWLEEPLQWHLQPADFAVLARSTIIPLAHGERELTRFTVRDFMLQGGIRFVQFDSTRYGGFTEMLRIAHLAEQCSVRIAPHHAAELHAHLCAAFPDASFGVESHGDDARDPLAHGIYRARAEVRDSQVWLSEAPGFGIEIDWAFVDRHRQG